jgi:hypothetical protein
MITIPLKDGLVDVNSGFEYVRARMVYDMYKLKYVMEILEDRDIRLNLDDNTKT